MSLFEAIKNLERMGFEKEPSWGGPQVFTYSNSSEILTVTGTHEIWCGEADGVTVFQDLSTPKMFEAVAEYFQMLQGGLI